MRYRNFTTDLKQEVMKTNNRLRNLLSLFFLSFLLTALTMPSFAQNHGRGNGRGKGNKHYEYRYEPRGRYQNYEGRRYYSRAPWGMRRPIILHHDRNRIYYYGGRYYEYYPNRGYVMIDIPMGYVFDEVPQGFNRVWIDGGWCYRRGDFYLRPGIHGFITFPVPAGIRIGAGF